jgi:hypothetical protein
MQTLEINGANIVWPGACACCLAPATHTVTSTKQKSTYLVVATVRRSMCVPVPYCDACHRHVLWSLGPGIVGVAFVSVLLFVGAAIVGLMLGFLVTNLLSATFPAVFPPDPFASLLSEAVLVMCTLGAGLAAAVIYARSHLRNRPGRRLGPEHFSSAPAVGVEDFGAQGITLALYNPRYAALLSRANPGSATSSKP